MMPAGGAAGTPGEAIDTLFVELDLRTAKLEQRVDEAMRGLERSLREKAEAPVERLERRFIGMGDVARASFQSVINSLMATHNPLQAAIQGMITFNGGVQVAAQAGNEWATSIAGITGRLAAWAVALTAVAKGLQLVINFLTQTGQQGLQAAARVETLTIGLGVAAKNAGVAIGLVRDKVTELQSKGIATGEAMEAMMQFLTQALPIDNIAKLARAGQDMAVAFGRNSTETFNRFVYAIMTGQNEVLRLVGINKTAIQMQEEYAKTLSKTAEALTQTEKRQAIINGILQIAQGYTGLYEESLQAVGKQMGSLVRYVQEGALAMGQTLLPVMSAGVQAATAFWKEFQKLFVVVKDGAVVLEQDGSPRFTQLGRVIHDVAQAIKDSALPFFENLIGRMKGAGQALIGLMDGLNALMGLLSKIGELGNKLNPITALGLDEATMRTASRGLTALTQLLIMFFSAALAGVQGITFALDNLLQGRRTTFLELAQEMQKVFKQSFADLAGIPIPTRAEPFRGRLTPPEPAAPAAPEAPEPDKRLRDLGLRLADAIEAGRKALDQAQAQFRESMRAFNEAVVRQQEALSASLAKALEKANENYNRALAKLEEDAAKQRAKLTERLNEERAAENEDFRERELAEQADFLLRMQRMEEDFGLQMQDAVAARDARAVLRLLQQHEINKRRANEDEDRRRAQAQEAHNQRMQQFDANEAEALAELEERLAERREELQSAYDEQVADLEENYREQMRLLLENAEAQRREAAAAQAKRLEEMKTTNDERLAEMVSHWADMEGIEREGAERVLAALEEYYGIDGLLEQMIQGFVDRMARNEAIETGIETDTTAGTTVTPVNRCPPGFVWDNQRQMCVPTWTTLGGRQGGGPLLAGQGAWVGERGPEFFRAPFTGTVVPAGAPAAGGGGLNRLEVDVRVTAGAGFSQAFEDDLLGAIAEQVVAALPGTAVRT